MRALEANKNSYVLSVGKVLDDAFHDDPVRRRRVALHLIYACFENEIEKNFSTGAYKTSKEKVEAARAMIKIDQAVFPEELGKAQQKDGEEEKTQKSQVNTHQVVDGYRNRLFRRLWSGA